MAFLEEYKRLEKLCNDMYSKEHGISLYIEDMLNHPQGINYVSSWNFDLKQLKHYRWLRNKLVHDVDCYEDEMCDEEDEEWLDDFYNRILKQKDPLALYRKAIKPKKVNKTVQVKSYPKPNGTVKNTKKHKKKKAPISNVLVTLLIVALIILFILIFLFVFKSFF